jgi:hypothetical protein
VFVTGHLWLACKVSRRSAVRQQGIQLFKKFADAAVVREVRQLVERRLIAVDDREERAGPLRQDGK